MTTINWQIQNDNDKMTLKIKKLTKIIRQNNNVKKMVKKSVEKWQIIKWQWQNKKYYILTIIE